MNWLQTTRMTTFRHLAMLFWAVGLSACMVMPTAGADSWKEEVLLHDGQKIIVERSQTYGGRAEVGQPLPAKEHTIRFTVPNSRSMVAWTSEYSEDLGRTDFNLLALHILQSTPFLIVEPNLCLSYNKWGRPNPPYVFFKFADWRWQRVGIADVPMEFKTINLIVNTSRLSDIREASQKSGFVSAEAISRINASLRQTELKEILREEVANAGGSRCVEMVSNGRGTWLSSDWFKEQKNLAACLRFCDQKDFPASVCPCNAMFQRD